MITSQVYPLADILQLEIDVYSDGANNFELKGSRNWVLPIVKNDFKLKTKIEASNVETYHTGVLLSVSQDFWMYAHFSNEVEPSGVINLYYLDTKGVSSKALKDAVHNQSIEVALAEIRPYVKAKHIKGVNELNWSSLPVRALADIPKQAAA